MNPAATRENDFSTEERRKLISLIKKYKHMIVNNRTDAVSTANKDKAWELITNEFNNQNINGVRSKTSIQNFWTSLKTKAIKYRSQFRREIHLAGGASNTESTQMMTTMERKTQLKIQLMKAQLKKEKLLIKLYTLKLRKAKENATVRDSVSINEKSCTEK